ncbi:uncharacterized protein EI90DRAFT_3065760 [Cantharellus anzutake]|uniref:uncharacterized protein n=1 Tax=Cantharellus anzutake TaxID=1750568 RepID=UPI001905FAEA|nr:uncharacterized protein EI90DRAFT_3065760 [Cantharellus anzutake]KAF8328156.1 hypothetical protein EI90DRAFT_3065760 [Cantharellus anzutake]
MHVGTTPLSPNLFPMNLHRLRVAVAQGHVPRIYEYLKLVLSPVNQPPPSFLKHDLKHITQLVTKRIGSPQATEDHSIQDIVILLASLEIYHPLASYMLLLIKSGCPERVLRVWELAQGLPHTAKNGSIHLPEQKYISDALGYVTSAAYLVDGRRSVLTNAVTYPSHLNTRSINAFLRAMNLARGLEANTLASLVSHMKMAKLLAHPSKAAQHLKHLIRSANLSASIKGMRGEDPWIAPSGVTPFSDDPRYLVSFTESLWSILLSGLARLGSMDTARLAWNAMTELGVEKTVISWNALLDAFGHHRLNDELVMIWRSMDQANIRKDFFSYTTMISSLFQLRRSDDAMAVFEEMTMLIENPKAATEDDSVSTFPGLDLHEESIESAGDILRHSGVRGSATFACNAVVHGCLKSSRLDDAERVLATMKSRGPKPDISTYNTFLRYYVRHHDYSGIAATLREISLNGLHPDVFTFTSIVHAYLRRGRDGTIEQLENLMKRTGVKPNAVTYTAIIDSVVRQGGEANIEMSLALVQKMVEQGLSPNEITYTSILAALYRDSSLGTKFVASKRDDIEMQMRNAGIPANRVTFHVLISAQLETPGVIGMSNALQKYQEMVEAGIKPRDDTFYLLLRGAIMRRDVESGAKIICEMDRIGFVPQGAVARIEVMVARRKKTMLGHI